jgi:hypothetical protein
MMMETRGEQGGSSKQGMLGATSVCRALLPKVFLILWRMIRSGACTLSINPI